LVDGGTLMGCARDSLVGEKGFRAVGRAWKQIFKRAPGGAAVRRKATDKVKQQRRSKIANYSLSPIGCPSPEFQAYLTRHEELYIEEICLQLEQLSFPFVEKQLGDLIVGIAQQLPGRENAVCSRRFWQRFYMRCPRVGKYKQSNMDIRRAEAATAYIRG